MLSIWIEGIGHPSTYFVFSDKSTRHSPPGRFHTHAESGAFPGAYVCKPVNKLRLSPIFLSELSGDDGI
jgi:hypothetical protein